MSGEIDLEVIGIDHDLSGHVEYDNPMRTVRSECSEPQDAGIIRDYPNDSSF